MKETGLTGKRRSTTIAATPDDGKSQRKRRKKKSEIIPSNVGFNITTYLSVKMQYYISLQLTFRRPNLQEHCEIQNQSKFVRREQVIVVIDQALHAKATEIAGKHTSIHANVMDTFHTIANLLAPNGKWFQDV